MKRVLLSVATLAIGAIVFVACQKQVKPSETVDNNQAIVTLDAERSYIIPSHPDCKSPYEVVLDVNGNGDGTYTWIWKWTNNNPGNGKNGTAQDLSHWGLKLEACVDDPNNGAKFEHIVSAAYSYDGVNWTEFTPSYKPDPSIANTCGFTTPDILKFDAGTSGSTPSYYKLVVNKKFSVNRFSKAYYKSGRNTGCGEICIPSFCCICEH
ncbi:hypothetical protein KJS94_13965 [Flavihumibacter rivuli]|uniref:hypothetical protein n=1 Tax=Flavihumibacter rivuli TaxID=2838156 RepID=UPI001BDF5FFA|nr:hypothetical protein [Flavihumibacter rivuli]ULQ55750.1 hypothetical protein KJS94_13965 [Flavihumibacter rivuli]